MATKKKVRGFKQSELVLPDSDVLPFVEDPLEPSRSTIMTPRTTTVRNLHAYARDEWAPKPLRGWLALRQSAGWFGIGRTWVPYWCAFDSRYLLLYPTKPGSQEAPNATGYSVTTLDPSVARFTSTVGVAGGFSTDIPLPSLMIDLGRSSVEAKFEEGQLYAYVSRPNYPDYVLVGNHLKYWIIEWQKINTTWTDETGAMLDVPTDVVDKLGNVMEPRMDMSERFFLRQQGAFLLYMAGPLQFEAWGSRLGDKWFLHFCTFDAYDPVPKLYIWGDGKDADDTTPPKIIDLTNAVISEHLDKRQRARLRLEIPGKPAIHCDGPNIQWWLGALQWATREKGTNKSMFRDLIKHRRFVPVEKSISVLRMQRRATAISLPRKNELKRSTLVEVPDSDVNGYQMRPLSSDPSNSKVSSGSNGQTVNGTPGKGDWKAKSAMHATTASTVNPGPRLSAAEFAKRAGQSPPRRRRSSAPKPDRDQAIRESKKASQRGLAVESRAQIPLISLGIPEDEEDGDTSKTKNEPNNQLSPRRKSTKPSKSRSPSVRTDSPLAQSAGPDTVLAEEMPKAMKSPRGAKSPRSGRSPIADVPLDSPNSSDRPKSPKSKASAIDLDDVPDLPLSPKSPPVTLRENDPDDEAESL